MDNKLKYPATPSGRRRYVHDSLRRTLPRSVNVPTEFATFKEIHEKNREQSPHLSHVNTFGAQIIYTWSIIYFVTGLIGLCGLGLSLLWVLQGDGSFLVALLSMLLVYIGAQGIKERKSHES